MRQPIWDALIITDPRFMGGTSAAVAADVEAFSRLGLRVGLHLVRSAGFFKPHETANPKVTALFDLPGVERVDPERTARARIAFFHHPAIFARPVENPISIAADRSLIVTHQAPFKGDGALDYDPFLVRRVLEDDFGVEPWYAPISGVCRRQFLSFAPLLRLTSIDWPNAFDVQTWAPRRAKLMTRILFVGRHGRPHPDKWPSQPADIAASLPAGPRTHVRIMGADEAFFTARGVDPSAWEVLPFNGEPIRTFLDSLDVFSYFKHETFVETFGRCVAEAMLTETRCILDPSLRDTFGPHAIYCRPCEVADVLETIRSDLTGEREAALAARDFCLAHFATRDVGERFEQLLKDEGTTSREGGAAVPPLQTMRKLTGYHRRRILARGA